MRGDFGSEILFLARRGIPLSVGVFSQLTLGGMPSFTLDASITGSFSKVIKGGTTAAM